MNHQAIEFISDFYLAAKAAIRLRLSDAFQHVFFHVFRLTHFLRPGFVHITMTGGTAAATATQCTQIMHKQLFALRIADSEQIDRSKNGPPIFTAING